MLAPSQVSAPGHSSSGSAPEAIGPQTPRLPPPFFASVQASQSPLQAVLQQTSSAQSPLAQVPAPPTQLCPFLSLHTPAPSQALFPVHVMVALPSMPLTGMFEQVPTEPPTLQAMQVPRQATLQHTPSMQFGLKHSAAAPQI